MAIASAIVASDDDASPDPDGMNNSTTSDGEDGVLASDPLRFS